MAGCVDLSLIWSKIPKLADELKPSFATYRGLVDTHISRHPKMFSSTALALLLLFTPFMTLSPNKEEVNTPPPLTGGGEPAGERHRGDREQKPAAAHIDHAVPEPADAEHQPPHHVPQRGHRRRCQRGPGPLPRGTDGGMGGGCRRRDEGVRRGGRE